MAIVGLKMKITWKEVAWKNVNTVTEVILQKIKTTTVTSAYVSVSPFPDLRAGPPKHNAILTFRPRLAVELLLQASVQITSQ
jgi:hypothetical protein